MRQTRDIPGIVLGGKFFLKVTYINCSSCSVLHTLLLNYCCKVELILLRTSLVHLEVSIASVIIIVNTNNN